MKLVRAMAWADLIHWYFGASTWGGIDLQIAARMGKPRLIEFWGSDLRDPLKALDDNPFLARMYKEHPGLLDEPRSLSIQRLFKQNGFECLIPGNELADYLDSSSFERYFASRARLVLSDFQPRFPQPAKARPLLVHAPSNQIKKGTEAVLRTINQLARTHQFDFRLIHQMPRCQALGLIAECDIFLDQFTIGAEGLASYEAMALGKPVICFIKPALLSRYPSDLPIVVADQSSLNEAIISLLRDGRARNALGRQGRNYVEQYHDARKVCLDLLHVYRSLCAYQSKPADCRLGHAAPLRRVPEMSGKHF